MDTIFNDNPNLDVAYKTADGKYFYTENGAQNHALTLKNKEVKKVVRTEDATEKEEVKNEVATETEEPQTVVTVEPSEPSENTNSSEVSDNSEIPEPSESTDSSKVSDNSETPKSSENSDSSENLDPSEEQDKTRFELKPNKQNKR
jgi:cell surface protein